MAADFATNMSRDHPAVVAAESRISALQSIGYDEHAADEHRRLLGLRDSLGGTLIYLNDQQAKIKQFEDQERTLAAKLEGLQDHGIEIDRTLRQLQRERDCMRSRVIELAGLRSKVANEVLWQRAVRDTLQQAVDTHVLQINAVGMSAAAGSEYAVSTVWQLVVDFLDMGESLRLRQTCRATLQLPIQPTLVIGPTNRQRVLHPSNIAALRKACASFNVPADDADQPLWLPDLFSDDSEIDRLPWKDDCDFLRPRPVLLLDQLDTDYDRLRFAAKLVHEVPWSAVVLRSPHAFAKHDEFEDHIVTMLSRAMGTHTVSEVKGLSMLFVVSPRWRLDSMLVNALLRVVEYFGDKQNFFRTCFCPSGAFEIEMPKQYGMRGMRLLLRPSAFEQEKHSVQTGYLSTLCFIAPGDPHIEAQKWPCGRTEIVERKWMAGFEPKLDV